MTGQMRRKFVDDTSVSDIINKGGKGDAIPCQCDKQLVYKE
jgi:hypothetical protein